MAIFFLPDIAADDYESFRRIIGVDMPDAFDKWANEQSNLAAQHLGRGNQTRSIKVNPDEFTAFLRKRGARGSRHELDNFVFEKSGL